MILTRHPLVTLHHHLPQGLFFAAAAVLAMEPVQWLVKTWRDPAYNTAGLLVFLVVVGMTARSLASPIVRRRGHRRLLPMTLLGASAIARLAGQVLAINTLGAVCLVIDVIALAMLLRLDARVRPLSPLWLGVAFAFCLPLERIVQRALGYALQHGSAVGACRILGQVFDRVTCHGARIDIAGTDVLVDLPCSGARGLLLCLLAFAIASALARPRPLAIVLGAGLTIVSAFAANVVRIVVLAIGIARPGLLGGIDVMSAPFHESIGLAALCLAVLPTLLWSYHFAQPARAVCSVFKIPPVPLPTGVTSDGWWLSPPAARHPARLVAAGAAVTVAVVVVNLPHRPIDVTRAPAPLALPLTLDGYVRLPVALSDSERAYFTRFGGAAAKARYGDAALMLIRTTSPLRHLHAPDECLRGGGFEVRYLGATFAALPTAIYRATAPDGRRYRIDVSFVSDRGEATTNVATAVWRWLEGRAHTWTAIQRITPERMPQPERSRFDRAVSAALELPLTPAILPSTAIALKNGDRP
jgi:exosortase/archaeosortase family protein